MLILLGKGPDFVFIVLFYLLSSLNILACFLEDLIFENVRVEADFELNPVDRKEIYKKLLKESFPRYAYQNMNPQIPDYK